MNNNGGAEITYLCGPGTMDYRGGLNYVINGNLNYKKVYSSSVGCISSPTPTHTSGSHLSYWNPPYQGTTPIGIPPYSLSGCSGTWGSGYTPPAQYFPYDVSYYCNHYDMSYLLPPNSGVYGGIFYLNLLKQNNNRNYFIMELSRPLDTGRVYNFDMIISPINYSDSNNIFIDQIGVVALDSFPVINSPYEALTGFTPDVQTKKDTIINTPLTLKGNIVGNGQKFLLVGCFADFDSISKSPNPGVNFNSKYFFDLIRVYDTICTGPNVFFYSYSDSIYKCKGDTVPIKAQYGASPYTWTIDGNVQSGTTNTINVPVTSQAQEIIVQCDTGMCTKTAKIYLHPKDYFLPDDTIFQHCDSIISYTYQGVYSDSTAGSTGIWYDVNSSWSTYANNTPYSTMIFPDTGTYYVEAGNSTCSLKDTLKVVNRGNILTHDSLNNPAYIVHLRNEDCFDMKNGFIQFLNLDSSQNLSYFWANDTTNTTSELLHIGEGPYTFSVVDQYNRCTQFFDTIINTFDSCGVISGYLYNDINFNCISDSSDLVFSNETVYLDSTNYASVTDSTGQYKILVKPGDWVVKSREDYFRGHVCNNSSVIHVAGADTNWLDLYDTNKIYHHELSIDYFNSTATTFIFYNFLYLNVCNHSDSANNGEITIDLPIHGMYIDTTYLNVTTYNDSIVSFTFNLDSAGCYQPEIYYIIPFDTALIGNVLTWNITLNPALDTDTTNNFASAQSLVISAFDPNNKVGNLQGGSINRYMLGNETYIDYLINFQNTGNSPAIDVIIADSISDKFDFSKFELLSSSHNVEVFAFNGVIYFRHFDIWLPDSTTNEPESHGYVNFRIGIKDGLAAGDSITNNAYIYFDNNPAIITNYDVHIMPYTLSQNLSSCDSLVWVNGITYYQDTSTVFNAQDTIYYLNYTQLYSSTNTDIETACGQLTWLDGNTYTTNNNSATYIMTNSVGCDSTIKLDLTINQSSLKTDTIISCNYYTWIDGNTYTSNNNTANYILTNSVGCDSIINLNLTINTIDTSVTFINGITLQSNNSQAEYQWLDCSNGMSPIFGDTNQTFTATSNGSYAIQISDSVCVDTSYCFTIKTVGINEKSNNFNLNAYPNPSSGEFRLQFYSENAPKSYELYSTDGKLIMKNKFNNAYIINIKEHSDGLYWLKVYFENGTSVIKIQKQ